MEDKKKLWTQAKFKSTALVIVSILLLLSVYQQFQYIKVASTVVEYQLKGIAQACFYVRQIVQDGEESYDYKTVAQKFISDTSSDFMPLSNIAQKSFVFSEYELRNFFDFRLECLLDETDPKLQERNLEILCQVADELEEITKIYRRSDHYPLYTSMGKAEHRPHLERIEEICASALEAR